jgi:hypothetical protein
MWGRDVSSAESISWKLAIGSINDIYETLTRFVSMKLCKSDIIRFSNNWIFASISTLLSDILTILGIIGN